MSLADRIPDEQHFYEKENNIRKKNVVDALSNLIESTNNELIKIINEEEDFLKGSIVSKINEIIAMVPITLTKYIIKLEKIVQTINSPNFHFVNINRYETNENDINITISINNFVKKYILYIIDEINKESSIKKIGGKTRIKNNNMRRHYKNKTNKNKTNKNKI